MFYYVKNKHIYKWKTPLFAIKGYLLNNVTTSMYLVRWVILQHIFDQLRFLPSSQYNQNPDKITFQSSR